MSDKVLDHVVGSKQAGLAFFDQAMIRGDVDIQSEAPFGIGDLAIRR